MLLADLTPPEISALALGLDRLLDELRRSGSRPPARLVQLSAQLHNAARTGLAGTSPPLSLSWPEAGAMQRMLMRIPQAAEALELSERTVKRLIASGELPAVKVLGSTRLRCADVEQYVRRLNTLALGTAGADLIEAFKAELDDEPIELRSVSAPLLELRALADPVEFRGAKNGRSMVASGVAMKYGAKSKPIDGQFRERFLAGSFTKTIREQDISMHAEHDGPYLGRTGAGTVRLTDGPDALRYELDLPDTSAGRDAAVLLERGDVKGSSVAFRALPKGDTWGVDTDGMPLRTVTEAKLAHIALVLFPAFDASTADMALRSLAHSRGVGESVVLDAAARGELRSMLTGEPPHPRRPKIGWLWS